MDVSTFNPILEGVCVECSTKGATPALPSPIPKCHCIKKKKKKKKKKKIVVVIPIQQILISTVYLINTLKDMDVLVIILPGL